MVQLDANVAISADDEATDDDAKQGRGAPDTGGTDGAAGASASGAAKRSERRERACARGRQ
ncbi:hypothetical protein [Burkholderia sp. 3C]